MRRNKYSTILSLLLASLLLTSCSWFKPKEVVVERVVYLKVEIPVKERPKALTLNDVTFSVVSEKNLQEYLSENEKRNGTVVFIAMDVRDYENLSLNTAEIERYIRQLLATIQYYEGKAKETRNVPETEESS